MMLCASNLAVLKGCGWCVLPVLERASANLSGTGLTGGTNYWEMLAFGIQSTRVAQADQDVDFNATPPY